MSVVSGNRRNRTAGHSRTFFSLKKKEKAEARRLQRMRIRLSSEQLSIWGLAKWVTPWKRIVAGPRGSARLTDSQAAWFEQSRAIHKVVVVKLTVTT